MNLAWKTIGGMAVALLLVGQGCAAAPTDKKDDAVGGKSAVVEKKTEEGAVTEKEEGEENEVSATSEDAEAEKNESDSAELKLTAEAQGGGMVKFTWTAPEGLTESNRFIIVRDEMENPEHTEKNFWVRFHHSKREADWTVPTGTMHFRLCLTENDEKDVCAQYSDDVRVEVK